MKKIISISFLIIFIILNISCSNIEPYTLELTQDEKDWLDKHPVLYYAADPEFAPYEYFENGEYKGIVSDYLKLLEDRLGIAVEIIDSPSWSNSLELGRRNEIDFMFMTKTSEREKYFYFTNSFLNAPNVMLVNDTSNNNFNMNNIDDFHIGILREYSSTEYFKLVYPSVKTSEYETIIDGLLELSYGNIDAFLVDLGQASFYINQLNITHLSISDDINFEYKFSLAVPKENDELLPILEKVVNSISETEHISIRDKWIQSQYKSWFSKDQLKIVYILLAVLLGLVIAALIWTFMLRSMVKQKTIELEILNQELEERVIKRTEELSNLNYELEASLDKLMETQEQLIESKKYEALGKLVSGVAHEINTPLGNAITSVSYNHRIISDLEDSFANSKLDRSTLKELIDDLYSSNALTNENLDKAALIISKFKLLEISRLTKNIEKIDLKAVVNMSIDNLVYQNLISDNVDININIQDDITIKSPVSWIEEISKNLILNSIQHNEGQQLSINILGKKLKNESIQLVFEDNGSGIKEDEKKRIFDPFFTHKNNRSNIGLGLSITHNIIVSNLFGSIILESEEGKFTRFTINLPKQI